MSLPSPKYQAWHKEASKGLIGANKGMLKPQSIHITIYAPDNRKSDLTNKAESIMDLLVDNQIIEDDNWFCCPEITLKFGGVDKDNPRAIIKLQ